MKFRRLKDMSIKPTEETPTDEGEIAIMAAELAEDNATVIDLHGKSVQAALKECDEQLHQSLIRGKEVLKIIHGRGLHSSGGEAKLKIAVLRWLEEQKRLDLVSKYRDSNVQGEQNGVTYAALHRLPAAYVKR